MRELKIEELFAVSGGGDSVSNCDETSTQDVVNVIGRRTNNGQNIVTVTFDQGGFFQGTGISPLGGLDGSFGNVPFGANQTFTGADEDGNNIPDDLDDRIANGTLVINGMEENNQPGEFEPEALEFPE